MTTTLFPQINVTDLALALGGVLLIGYAYWGVMIVRHRATVAAGRGDAT